MQIADQVAGGDEPEEIKLFFSSLRSEETRKRYKAYFKKYQQLTGLTVNDIISEKDEKKIALQIINFINRMKDEGMNWGAIHNYKSMITAFYKYNDIVLNTYKINKSMPEQRSVRKDRVYRHEEISKMLQLCDERSRVLVLLLASTGMRIGAIPDLRIGNIDNSNNKITVYENAKEQYFTFMTPECKQAIDSYLDYRARYGEKIEDDCFLIREQFDKRDKFKIANSKCRPITRETMQGMLKDIAKRSNVKSKQVPVAHGFRKFFATQLDSSNVDIEIRERLLGHDIGLTLRYVKPTVEKMSNEYQKAINNLTINEENRLKIKVQLLESEKTNYERLDAKIDELNRKFLEKNVSVGINPDNARPMTEEEIQHILNRRRFRDNVVRRRDKKLAQEL